MQIFTGSSRLDGTRGRRNPHSTLPSTVLLALASCVAFFAPAVNAEDPITFHVPSQLTLCQLVNFTWTGGTPPYRLDVEPLVNNVPNITADQRTNAILNTWTLWTPDFPAGSTLEINVVGSEFSPSAGGFSTVLPSSDSSCLSTASTTASTTSSQSTSSSSANGPITPVDQPSATSSPAILASSGGGLSKGAIAGIAVAASLIGVGLIALAAWCLLRRRNRVRHPEKGYDRSIVSPAFSDDAPTVPYSGLSSTLISVDPNKLYASTTPPTSVLGGSGTSSSSPDDRDRDPLRPRPYLVPRESLSDLRGGKKHIRELSNSNESPPNMSMSTSDVRAPTASPSQLGSADGRQGGEDEGGDGDVLRFDGDGAARLSLSLSLGSAVGGGLGLGFSDAGASDVASHSGEAATLPPPYAHYFNDGAGRSQAEDV
ncbi:hypothetical protein LXA43DRAFT_900815 [Ganoderma leucocontextum]|nr:hypothetical protein LXA43DRAFT_900815 [Ganoderma leucocontextum]